MFKYSKKFVPFFGEGEVWRRIVEVGEPVVRWGGSWALTDIVLKGHVPSVNR